MMRVNEIFYSLQGEGYWTGTPSVFIRFSGCNLHCGFCDTSHEDGRQMSEAEILADVAQYPARHVVLTGGEPSLQVTESLVAGLHEQGRRVAIETNGTRCLPKGIDWITCSPKTGGDVVLEDVDELKVVFLGQDFSQYDGIRAKWHFIQPCSGRNTEACVAWLKQHPDWRLSLQTHKILNIR